MRAADVVRGVAYDAVKLATKPFIREGQLHSPINSFYRAPKLTNLKINFEADDVKKSIVTTLEKIKVTNESHLNLQVKAGTNTIFNLTPALIFTKHTRELYPKVPITVSIRLDDWNESLLDMDQSQLLLIFKQELLGKLLKRSFPEKTSSELDAIKVDLLHDLNEAQIKNGIKIKFIPQKASNSTYESYEALTKDYSAELRSTHFIEFAQNAALQNRSNIGVSVALKELQRTGKRTYPNITNINTSNYKGWCPLRDSVLEQVSELYDTTLNVVTGKTRDPNSPSGFLSRLKYRISEGLNKNPAV
jgi:hypothetical protein